MKKKLINIVVLIGFLLVACTSVHIMSNNQKENTGSESNSVQPKDIDAENLATEKAEEDDILIEDADQDLMIVSNNDIQTRQKEILHFVDVFGQEYIVDIDPLVNINKYKNKNFRREGQKLFYDDEKYTSRMGVDVSHHQNYIDWEKVKAAGYDFAILRIGYRGYGKTGSLNRDTEFERNLENAHVAGLDVGVYFFAQAINETEAKEEADFVLNILNGRELELPVVYDPESILDAEARTDNVSGEQFTQNTIVFCEAIQNAGYQSMIYSNMLWEAYEFELRSLSDIPVWYADYELLPQTPYHFEYWQYTNSGYVDGIEGGVDLDIQILEKK